MQNAAQAYSATTKATTNPRNLEATLLIKAAANIQSVQDNWEEEQDALGDALMYNRKLWSVLLDAMTRDENPLPQEIKNNIGSLGVFILNHTLQVQRSPSADQLGILISINQEIAAGLRSQSQV